MAGSYNHIIDNKGNLVSNERFANMVENRGDAYETIEEMYGMIWWLAHMGPDSPPMSPEALVEQARQHYAQGLILAGSNKNKVKHRGY